MLNKQETAMKLYNLLIKTGGLDKHHGYHILPERIDSMLNEDILKPKQIFYEKERMAFIRSKIDFCSKSILDIGCNIGYFLFGALDDGASSVTGYEGKASSCEFLENAIKFLGMENCFKLHKKYYDFTSQTEKYDVIILLNVLHHIGDDFGDNSMTMETAKATILEQINKLSKNASFLICQIGFNWQGDIKKCLFEHGTKQEMIDYLKEGINDRWEILATGIPQRDGDQIIYKELNSKNICRDDSLGEFLNRPLFILKSKEM